MGQLSKKLRSDGGRLLMYWCQGCKHTHTVRVGGENRPAWNWNGDAERPTFTPSVLVTGRDFTEKGEAEYEAWVNDGCPGIEPEFEARDKRCHTFITDGMVQFLSDCTHQYAGQTLPLPDLPEHLQDETKGAE